MKIEDYEKAKVMMDKIDGYKKLLDSKEVLYDKVSDESIREAISAYVSELENDIEMIGEEVVEPLEERVERMEQEMARVKLELGFDEDYRNIEVEQGIAYDEAKDIAEEMMKAEGTE